MSCTKTAKPIEMLFGTDACKPKKLCIRWTSRYLSMGRGTFEGDNCNVPMHQCTAHCSFAAAGECACPAHAATNAFAVAKGDKTAMRLLSN